MRGSAAFAVLAVLGPLMLAAVPAVASSVELDARATPAGIEASAQSRPERIRRRPPLQLRVYPRYPYRTFHTPYPLPYPIEYPGPNAVRHCVSNLVQEHRPSGTVIVPRMRCWWVPR